MAKYTYGDRVRVAMSKIYKEFDMVEEERYYAFIDTVITDVIEENEEVKYKLDYCLWDNEPLIIDESLIVSKLDRNGNEIDEV